ncbi:MAG: ThuA domain-containing protein, partial [Gemmatimonadetes bacterium]|nr:ThuA domain-containing protein [Gemmatimonadota bacterium]
MRFYVLLYFLFFASESLAQIADVRVLIFSRTAGFRHASIPDGIAAIRRLADEREFFVEASEDPTVFRDGQLEQYRAVVFLSTTGDILTRPQEEAFERYIRRGGGFVGIHAAADTRCRPLDEYSGCQGCFTTLG